MGGEPIKATDYTHLGSVTEFKFSAEIGKAFRGGNQLKYLKNFGEGWGFLKSHLALTFVGKFSLKPFFPSALLTNLLQTITIIKEVMELEEPTF